MTIVQRRPHERTERRIARKRRLCTGYRCERRWIEAGEAYLMHTAYPGGEFTDHLRAPVQQAECADCARGRLQGHLLDVEHASWYPLEERKPVPPNCSGCGRFLKWDDWEGKYLPHRVYDDYSGGYEWDC